MAARSSALLAMAAVAAVGIAVLGARPRMTGPTILLQGKAARAVTKRTALRGRFLRPTAAVRPPARARMVAAALAVQGAIQRARRAQAAQVALEPSSQSRQAARLAQAAAAAAVVAARAE